MRGSTGRWLSPFPSRMGAIRAANDYVLDVAKTDKRVLPFVAVDLRGGRSAVAEAERCSGLGARGVGELAYYKEGFGERERTGPRSLRGSWSRRACSSCSM